MSKLCFSRLLEQPLVEMVQASVHTASTQTYTDMRDGSNQVSACQTNFQSKLLSVCLSVCLLTEEREPQLAQQVSLTRILRLSKARP